MTFFCCFFFFFSSRRRHTRCLSDWSSDVCSSDLIGGQMAMYNSTFARARRFLRYHAVAQWTAVASSVLTAILFLGLVLVLSLFVDLVVSRGEVPCYLQLSEPERSAFHAAATLP